MFLEDIGHSPSTTFRKVNNLLKENYGFTLSSETTRDQIISVATIITEEINTIVEQGADVKRSPEVAKRLLILEGLKSLDQLSIGYEAPEMKSPEYDGVIDDLVNFVVDYFTMGGLSESDFQRAISIAMDQYNRSQFMFDSSRVQGDVEQRAREQLASAPSTANLPIQEPEIDDNSMKSFPMMEENNREKAAIKARQDGKNEVEDEEEMFEVIKENMVKNLRVVLESKVSQAEVMIAAKGFSGELQEMIEKIGRLQNEDLPPVTDQMRQTYGGESASTFQTQIYSAFQGVMDALYTAKTQVDEAVESLASTGRVGVTNDMDATPSLDNTVGSYHSDEDADADPELDLDNIDGEEDEFGGAEDDAPLGREEKEEMMESLAQKVEQMRSLVEQAKALKLK